MATETDEGVLYDVYRDRVGQWRWRLRHRSGNILLDGGEGYSSRSEARRHRERQAERAERRRGRVTPAYRTVSSATSARPE